jgi:hypothetical protein
MNHDSEHEHLLERLVTGEADARDADVLAALARCAACARAWEALQRVRATLDSGERERRAVFAALAAQPAVAHEGRALDALRAELSGAPPDARPGTARRPNPWMLAAAAVLLVVCGWMLRSRLGPARPDDTLLGGSEVELLPVPAAGAEPVFAWRYALAPGHRFELSIVYRSAQSGAMMTEQIDAGRDTQWIPSPERRADWSDELRWRVQVLDAQGEYVARSDEAVVRLSR